MELIFIMLMSGIRKLYYLIGKIGIRSCFSNERKDNEMAKYTARITGDLDDFRMFLEKEIVSGSSSAALEDEFRTEINGVRCCTQVYERYSVAGGNRLSLTVTMVSDGSRIDVGAITAGGSQAIFFKVNTWGEGAFLDKFIEAVESYSGRSGD